MAEETLVTTRSEPTIANDRRFLDGNMEAGNALSKAKSMKGLHPGRNAVSTAGSLSAGVPYGDPISYGDGHGFVCHVRGNDQERGMNTEKDRVSQGSQVSILETIFLLTAPQFQCSQWPY